MELSIAMALASIVALASYKLITTQFKKTGDSVRAARNNQELEKLLDRMNRELNNAVSIPVGENTVLSSLAPAVYPAPPACDSVPLTVPGQMIPSGLVPLPQRSYDDLPADLIPIDPSVNVTAPAKSDAIRIAFLAKESAPLPLALESETPLRTYSTTGSNPIVLDSAEGLSVGDYAIISGSRSSDLFRITGITNAVRSTRTVAEIEHSPGTSVWNEAFEFHYGGPADGKGGVAFVQKINIMTYAHNPAESQLLFDNHVKDDGFEPNGSVFGSRGRSPYWSVMATQISQFRIHYDVKNASGKIVSTRTPRAGEPEDPVNCSKNQIGYPALKGARIEIEHNETVKAADGADREKERLTARAIDVTNLTRPPASEEENLIGAEKIICPDGDATCPPVPEFTPTAPFIGLLSANGPPPQVQQGGF